MPMPVSATEMMTQSRPSSCPCREAMVMVPWSVNLLALLNRFKSACRSWRSPKACDIAAANWRSTACNGVASSGALLVFRLLFGRISGHRFLGSFQNAWQLDRKGRAAAQLARDRDVAAHHLAEALADREPKTGAAVFAGSGGKAAVARGAPLTADAEFPPPRAVYLGCPTGPNKRTSGDCGGSPSCRAQLGIQP